MAEQSSALTPQYVWSDRLGRYRNVTTGRIVAASDVRQAIEGLIEYARVEMADLGRDLAAGRIGLQTFHDLMLEQIKLVQLANVAAARGGWAQLDAGTLGRVEKLVERQIEYLQGFAAQIEAGTQQLSGVERRALLYAEAGRGAYEGERALLAVRQGSTECRSLLGAGDHCRDCLDMAAGGWMPIQAMLPIGARACTVNCRCEIEYRQDTAAKIN